MKNPSKKKLERRHRKDAERTRQNRERAQRADALSSFPTFRYEQNAAPFDLLRAVKRAVSTAVSRQSKVFNADQLLFLRGAKSHGFKRVVSAISDVTVPTDDIAEQKLAFAHAISPELLANTVFEGLPAEVRTAYFPTNAFRILYGRPRPNEILVVFDSLEPVKIPSWGTAYRSRAARLMIDGAPRVVAFMRHAIDRIAERSVGFPGSYLGSRLTFHAISGQAAIMDQCQLRTGEHAIRLWVRIQADDESPVGRIPAAVLGQEPTAGAEFCYLAGYCPVVFHGRDIAAAKTLLAPGMKGTPEASILDYTKLDLRTQKRVQSKIDDQSFRQLFDDSEDGLDVMRVFHTNGFEQVRPTT